MNFSEIGKIYFVFQVIFSILKQQNGQMTENDLIRGSLVGGAIGDALGYAIEFYGENKIFSHYGERGITNLETDPQTGKAPISDDTQMTLFTAEGIINHHNSTSRPLLHRQQMDRPSGTIRHHRRNGRATGLTKNIIQKKMCRIS